MNWTFWTRFPATHGYLTITQHVPYEGTREIQVMVCQQCTALTVDPKTHSDWHDELQGQA